jgi:lipoprotein LprG
MTIRRSGSTVALLLAASLALSSCSRDSASSEEQTPEEALAAAKATLDDTSGVHLALSADELPKGVSGILSADGIGTHAPAFEGTLQVVAGGLAGDADVVAVDDVVYAKLPWTTGFAPIDPADYAAPDPADLMGTESGLSSLLTALEDAERGEQVRAKDLLVTEYTGTVPGAVVAAVIPTASPDSDFDAVFTLTDDNVLNEAELTGPFYPGAEEITYTIRFDEYGTTKDITAP